jgi:hypothetical protein
MAVGSVGWRPLSAAGLVFGLAGVIFWIWALMTNVKSDINNERRITSRDIAIGAAFLFWTIILIFGSFPGIQYIPVLFYALFGMALIGVAGMFVSVAKFDTIFPNK